MIDPLVMLRQLDAVRLQLQTLRAQIDAIAALFLEAADTDAEAAEDADAVADAKAADAEFFARNGRE